MVDGIYCKKSEGLVDEMKMSGGEALAKSLAQEGVDVIFGITGIEIYGLAAGLRDESSVGMITTRHEQAAAHMADGYARASGRPGVAMVVPGCGLLNAASGLATAYSRSSPVLLIAGQIPRGLIGKNKGVPHEISNQGEVVRPVTKWQRMVTQPREVPAAVNEAFRQMRTGRPRPVLIEIPPEVAVEREEVELLEPAPVSPIVPGSSLLRRAAAAIAESKLPIIYAGGGVSRANAEATLLRFAEATNIPVITSNGGKGVMSDSHPLCYGSCFSPRGEIQEMNQLFDVMQSADLVIGVGARFSLGNPAGNDSTLVNINIDHNELTKVQTNAIPLHGDAHATLEALLPAVLEESESPRPSPAEAVAAARRLIQYHNIRLIEPQYRIMETVKKSTPDDTLIAWDVTQLGFYARTHYQVNHPKTFIDPGYVYNLGYALPTALGAKVAQPDRAVLCMAGDGGFMFNASELSTAVKYGINVVTVIFRNDSYGNVSQDMNEVFGGTYETDLSNPDFVKFAESFGAVGIRADNPLELETLIPEALAREAPVVIDVPMEDIPIPKAPQIAPFYALPWTMPQEGLIQS